MPRASYPFSVVVNVCPAAVTSAPPERVWSVVSNPQRFGEWLDVTLVSVPPPGPAAAGQVFSFATHELGRRWSVTIKVEGIDPGHRWIDLLVSLPLGIVNHERVTLTPTDSGGTLVRFN